MAMRLSGLVSGLDTDAVVKELVSAHALKKEKIVKVSKVKVLSLTLSSSCKINIQTEKA